MNINPDKHAQTDRMI
jgi:hypothetical protein